MECSAGCAPTSVCISVPSRRLMRGLFRVSSLALLISSAFAGEGTYKPPISHYYCTSNPAPKTRYYSALFDLPASAVAENQAATDFKHSLSKKYGVNAAASCQGNPDQNAAQAQMQQAITQLKAAKWKIVETGWTNSGSLQAGNGVSHPDCNDADAWKSVAEYKAACENGAQSSAVAAQGSSSQSQDISSQGSPGQIQNSTAGASSAGVQSNTNAAGTTLTVQMLEAADSAKDGMGHQYRGIVTQAADAGSMAIPRGSAAIIVLTKSQSGWVAQLHSVMVKGQTISVSSGPATLMNSTMGSAQNMASGAMNTVSSALGGFGFGHKKPHAPSEAEAVASGNRVVLPPGTQLRFVLSGVSSLPSAAFGGGNPGMAQPMGVGAASIGAAPNTIAGGSGGALKAKISEVVLGPAPSKAGGKYVVSPDGGHYAAFAMHGSRELIIIDGVEGPEFDHAGHAYTVGAIDVVFTKDGKHSAYVGQSGDSLMVVMDGKQRATVEQLPKGAGMGELQGVGTTLNYPPTVSNQAMNMRHPILLSPSGAHYACIATDPGKPWSHMVLDGVRGPDMMAIDQDQVAFVNEQLVYVATTPDRKRHVVVNDKPGPEYDEVRFLRVTDDAKHYAFAAQQNGAYMVVVDGKPGTPRHFLTFMQDLVFSSNARTAYMAQLPAGGPVEHNEPVLFVDDHEVAKDVRPFTGLDRMGNPLSAYVVFSPDGSKYAYAKVIPGGVAAVVEGKVGRAYDGIGIIQFSQDSKHDYFVGQRGQYFVVADGKEMTGVNRMENFIFSNDGMHFAYLAYMQDGNHVVVDGKESPRYYNFIGHSLAFSPDSKHYIYAACPQIMKCEVVRDGSAITVPGVSEFSARTLRPVYMFPPVFFSPDSNQVAYSYSKSDGTSQSVYVINGQEVVHGTTFEFPSFSPDSKHFVVMGWNGHGYSFFADGKLGPGYQELLEANLNIARFENPNTYRFLGIKDGSVYRVTVDLASTN